MNGREPSAAASPAAPPSEAAATPAPLTLLYREGCHLCAEMEALLHELLPAGSFALTRVDIDEHPALLAEHHVRVPVLSLDGTELCHHFLDLQAVTSALAGYNRPAGPSRARRPASPSASPPAQHRS